MKSIIYNKHNLKDEEINRIVRRAKILIINSKEEILMVHCHNNYYLVGGHLEDDESFDECIVKELKEETGIDIPLEKREPYFIIEHLNKDYPSKGINSKSIANYYILRSDVKPDLSKINLTSDEKEGNFELKYIHKSKILKELESSLENYTRRVVVIDTIEAVKEFLNNYK